MIVYHFLSKQYGLEALRNKRLKIAEIDKLNDPFEFLGYNLSNDNLRKRIEAIKENLSRHTGILCFSEEYNNPVQWAHYSDKYQGICLGFDIPDKFLYKVKYIQKRPPFPNVINFDEEVMKKLLLRKFKHWKYEKEWRMYIELEKAKKDGLLHFEDFSNHLYLKEVFIGYKSAIAKYDIQEQFDKIQNDIKISFTRLSTSEFKIVRAKIPN